MVYNCAKFQNHRAFRKRFTEGGAESAPPPAVLGFKKPGLFRVKEMTKCASRGFYRCAGLVVSHMRRFSLKSGFF